MKSFIKVFVVIFIIAVISVFAVMYSGMVNIAASEKHSDMVSWILTKTRESSIEKYAQAITVPDLSGSKRIENGFRSYREMCAVCHTPPGDTDSPIAQGLNPPPTDLAEEATELNEAELFWVIKNGIRMTGMPAWGVTHGDEELWDIVAFVRALPNISAGQYQELDRTTAAGHSHGPGGHDMDNAGDHEAGGHDMGSQEHGQDSSATGGHHQDTESATSQNKAKDHHADDHAHGEHTH